MMLSIVATGRRSLAHDPELLDLVLTLYVVSRTRIAQSIFGSIQEYAGFERKAWLE
jgi:hypothetical protein